MPRYENVPDDWGNHFVTCEACKTRYHASEKYCGACDLAREKAAERNCKCGYEFQPEEFEWDAEGECWVAYCPGCEEIVER